MGVAKDICKSIVPQSSIEVKEEVDELGQISKVMLVVCPGKNCLRNGKPIRCKSGWTNACEHLLL